MKSFAAESAAAAVADRHWRAQLSLGFADDNGTTRLVERAHDGPLRVQKPLYPEGGKVCHTIVVHPPGGVVGGDRLTIDAIACKNASAFITTPGAAKWYRANGHVSRQDVSLEAKTGATLEWLPQETIFFNEARVALEHTVDLADDAAYIGWEILCFGRTASGETFSSGRISQRTNIRRNGKLLWLEQGSIGAGAAMNSLLALGGHTVCATLIAVGTPPSSAILQTLREQAAMRAGDKGKVGATQMKQVCVLRFLGDSSELAKQVMIEAWQTLRPAMLGRPAVVPRIWNT